MKSINYYKIALATGLTEYQARLYASAMAGPNSPNINYLTIK